jgi:hypothetical protein
MFGINEREVFEKYEWNDSGVLKHAGLIRRTCLKMNLQYSSTSECFFTYQQNI